MSDITKSFEGVDKKGNAGFKTVFIANYAEYDFTESADEHSISAIPAGIEVYKFNLKNTGNTFTETVAGGRDTGTIGYTGTLSLVFTNVNARKSFQVQKMVIGRPIVFAEMNNGEVIMIGRYRGVEFAGTSMAIEGALEGANAYQLEGVANEIETAWFLTDEAITALKAAVVEPV